MGWKENIAGIAMLFFAASPAAENTPQDNQQYLVGERLSSLIASHVEVLSQGHELSCIDFYHGHFLLEEGSCDSKKTIPKEKWEANLDSFFMVYHTKEAFVQPFYLGLPRSFIGLPDGNVMHMERDDRLFHVHGSVSGMHPFRAGNAIYDGCPPLDDIVFDDGTVGEPKRFFIVPNPDGRYVAQGKRYDIFYDTFDPSHCAELKDAAQSARRERILSASRIE